MLSYHPNVQHKAQHEVDEILQGKSPTYEDLSKLVYITAIIKVNK